MISEDDLKKYQKQRKILENVAKILKCSIDDVSDRIKFLVDDVENLENEKREYLRKLGRL